MENPVCTRRDGGEPRPPIDAYDWATWPTELQERERIRRDRESKLPECHYSQRYFFELRRDAVLEAVLEWLGCEYRFYTAAVAELLERVPFGTLEGRLVGELEGLGQSLVTGTIEACFDLLPKLERILPYESLPELVEAVKEGRPVGIKYTDRP